MCFVGRIREVSGCTQGVRCTGPAPETPRTAMAYGRRRPRRVVCRDREQRRPKAAMRWWGWGDEGVSFTHEDKPALGPFLERNLDIDVTRAVSQPTAFDALDIPEPSLAAGL